MKSSNLKLLAAISSALLAFNVQASTTTYSDYDNWIDNVSGVVTTDTFNSYDFSGVNGHNFGSGVTLGANTFFSNGVLFGNSKDVNNDATYLQSNYIEWKGGNDTNSLTISFSGFTNAVGFKFGQFDGSASNFDVTLGNGDSYSVTGNNAYSFFGAISTVAFNKMTITSASYPVVDNLSLAPVTSVPEPEEWAMMMLGLPLMGFVARRRKSSDSISFQAVAA